MVNKKYNFGYTKVDQKQKTKLVQNVFTSVASNYDIMNDLMSLGMHRLWKSRCVEIFNPEQKDVILDVGSGSGDIAYELSKKNLNLELYLLDLNKKMLDQGKKRFKNENNINFIESDAEKLDFNDNFFDKYIISFCLRNITNYKQSIKEAYRVLKPGGKYCCLEFSSPRSSIISDFYKVYKSKILPLLGDVVANDRNAYKYLSESIDLFPTQDELKKILISYGFENVKFINLFNGIVAIHIGYKI